MDSKIFEQIKKGIEKNNQDYKMYLELADAYLDENPYLTYLCLENALFLCPDEAERENIFTVIDELIKEGIYVRPASFVILSYNTKEFTATCIESIRKTVPESAREIIVVDNASTDGSVEYLKKQTDIKLILNQENVGFPKGCNQGIEASDPDTDIFLLNNDTVLLPNSFFWLRMGLYSSDEYGTAGSVTNHAGNNQTVSELRGINVFEKEGFDRVYEVGMKTNVLMPNALEKKIYLIGFALLIKREVINEVGMLDEIFTPGNYEDNDYGIRVLEAGYQNILVHNSFILHFGSVSFGKKREQFLDLLRNNREKIKNKMGYDITYFQNARDELLSLMNASQDAPLKVLELGCGLGATGARIKYLYPQAEVFGVDISETVVQIANSFMTAYCADVENFQWPFEDEYFDYVIMGDVLEHLRRPDKVLQVLNRLVKRGGHIILSMPNMLHYSVMIPLLVKGEFTYQDAGILDTTHLKMYTKYEIEKLIITSGFTPERVMYTSTIEPNEAQQKVIDILVSLMEDPDPEAYISYQYVYVAKKN